MVLPDLSRTMANTLLNIVNRLVRNELNLNPVVLERQSKENNNGTMISSIRWLQETLEFL